MNQRGRPKGTVKFKHPITQEPLNIFEYEKVLRKLKLYPEEKRIYDNNAIKKYISNNPERYKQLQKQWQIRNKEHIRQWHKKYNSRPEIRQRKNKYMRIKRRKERCLKMGMTPKEYLKFISQCSRCGFKEYKADIHHINHNNKDNRKENLIALCPNCHMGYHRGKIKLFQH
jgi:hypothetical protein